MSKYKFKVGDRVWAMVQEKKERLGTIVSAQYDNPVDDCFEINFDGINYPAWKFASEIRPAGKPAKIEGGGTKHDSGKPRTDLLPPDALLEVSKVFTFGGNKYGDYNWCKGFKWSRLLGAALRHLFAFMRGEDKDPESNHSHLAHAACCVLMLISHEQRKLGEDDRWKS
jgi:hypothetical protein